MKRAHLFDSLTFRVTLAYLLFLAAAVALLLAGGWWFGVQAPLGRMERLVAREAREIAALYHASGPEAAVRRLELRRRDPLPTMAFHALIERDGSVVSANLPSWPAVRRDGWQRFEADLYRDGDEDDHEALSRDMLLPDGRRLIVGRDIEAIADRQELIEEGALWGSLAVLLLGLSGGLVLSRTIGRRLERVSRMARTVMAGDLGGRIETSGSNDDFDQLSRTLNLMLDRIEELVASVSRVSDSIAHELRTPLTRLRADLDTLVRETGGDRERMLAARAVAEAEALQRTFDSLLRIARLETGRHAPAGEAVALDALLLDAVELYEPEAAARAQTITLAAEPGLSVRGDRNLLFQAAANLLDNAVKFTPHGGRIEARASGAAGAAMLSVRDSGPGVAAEHWPRLSERFYRAPGSEAVSGTGLGLSLVAAVARAHDAVLGFAADASGFEVRLTFPAASREISST